MPEVNVRDCYIHLLDGYKLTVQVRPLQLASDLMSIIATQLKLKEKECFGLYYEVSGEYQYWLEPGRPVVEQVPGADIDIIILHFGAMLYHENFKHLQDGVAIGLYYIQCQQLVAKNLIQCQHHTLIKLTSLVLQAQMGDFTTEQVVIEGLKEIKYLPSSSSSTEYEEYEEDILTQYRQLIGIQKKDAIMTYLEIVQELPSYGMHFYDVKDRNDVQKLIGIGLYGISQFNIEYRNRPEQVYLWTGISKISSRENKFILEFRNQALDLDKLLVDENVINTTSQCQSIMSAVQSWYSDSHQLIRVMEQMAATQLSYFEKRKKFRVGIRFYSPYSSSSSSINSIGSITLSSSACTQKSDNSISSMETTQAIRMASKERYSALKIRKEELEKVIEEKEAELRRIMLEEAKLTGITPNDLTEEERASLPKKVSTSYTLPNDFLISAQQEVSNPSVLGDPENDKELKRLSRAFEVQCNIVKAEYKIYKGHYTSKRIKKQRKKNYKSSEKKLKELEKELEKKRDSLGIAFRQSRFYSGVDERDTYQWEVTKSFTLPHKPNALSVVDENKIAQHAPNKKGTRHSSALPLKIEPPLMKVRPKHSNTSYAKRSNTSDSVSTASPMDGSSFLSLCSRDSSSHLSSGSISSDESRCISCPATEKCIRKQAALKNERQKRVSQHLDLALPERAIKEKKKETIDILNLDITNQVIFKPSTHYPEPLHASLPFSASTHSAKDFYTKSLPLDYYIADTNTYGKYQYTSDQISKQQYQQKLVYTQQNTNHINRSPSPLVTAANTKYPLPYMRVNSVPHGLHSSRSPLHDQIIPSQLRSDLAHSQTLVTPSNTSRTLDRYPYHYGGTHIHSNGVMKPAVPITRIHTSPNNITTLEYNKPTHYPQNTSPKLKNKDIQPKIYHKPDLRIPTVPVLYQPHTHTHNPASNMYTNPPVCQIQIIPPEGQQYCITQNRFTTPYNYQSTSEDRYIPNQYHQQQQPHQQHQQQHQQQPHQQQQQQHQQHQQQHQRPSYLKTKSHDPLGFTTSLPMPQQVSPNIKCKIDYWEQHTVVNSIPNSIHSSKSLEKIAKQSYTPTETNTPVVVKSMSFRNTFAFENSTLSDEGTPV